MTVENTIKQLLEHAEEIQNSEDVTLTEEDLELFSEEEINQLIENMDQLDELSKKTLSDYVAKSSIDTNKNGKKDRTSNTIKAIKKLSEEAKSRDIDNAEELTRKVRAKVGNQDKNENGDANYKNATGTESKEFVIKKEASFTAGDQTEELTMEDIEAMSQEDTQIDLGALFDGEELTEEFKTKATTIFEAAVAARVVEELDSLKEELIEANEQEVADFKEGFVERIDGFLGYIAEQWIRNNEVALDRGIKADLFESFVSGMKNLFEEHYITLPEEEMNVVEEMTTRTQELESLLDESTAHNVELTKALNEVSKFMEINEAVEGLSEIQAEKFRALVENIAYDDEFSEKLETIRENYFSEPEAKTQRQTFVSDAPVESLTEEVQPQLTKSMQAYTSILK